MQKNIFISIITVFLRQFYSDVCGVSIFFRKNITLKCDLRIMFLHLKDIKYHIRLTFMAFQSQTLNWGSVRFNDDRVFRYAFSLHYRLYF